MSAPKTIQLFLMDGTATGRKKASLDNWTGVAYLLPRKDLHLSKDREDLKQSGVYLLFGTDENDVAKVYVGQGRERKNLDGVLGRIQEHIRANRHDYWTHAVILVTSNGSFGPTEISYLENRFTQMAKDANRYEVVNSNDPSPGNVTEEKQASLDEFIQYSKLVIGVLGYRVFEPVDARNVLPTRPEPAAEPEPLLSMSLAEARAQGRRTSDGFVVHAGARLRPESSCPRSAPASIARNRARRADKITPELTLIEDILFDSPTGAAEFVGGASLNGLDTWKTADGETLKQLESKENS